MERSAKQAASLRANNKRRKRKHRGAALRLRLDEQEARRELREFER